MGVQELQPGKLVDISFEVAVSLKFPATTKSRNEMETSGKTRGLLLFGASTTAQSTGHWSPDSTNFVHVFGHESNQRGIQRCWGSCRISIP
jgi:hypothetical protein